MRTLKTLRFSNNSLSQLPEGLGDDQILHTIDARNNKIENLSQPMDLRKLRLLEVLLLGGNQITLLPRVFESNLYSLREIDMSNNQIVGFLMPKSLTSIDVSSNPIHMPADDTRGSMLIKIGDESHVRTMQKLSLASLQMEEIPAAVLKLRMLTELNLSNNHLTELPEELFKLRCLRVLYLQNNQLKTFAGALEFLPKLQHLDLHENQITEFSADVTKLRSLGYLDFSKNSLASLPDDFGELNQLVTLNLADNELLTFPNDKIDVLASLVTLDLTNNHVDTFPIDFPYLYRIEVVLARGNDLTDLPKDIDKMRGLRKLDVADNVIGALPEKLVKCPNIADVDCSNNKIMAFPKTFEKLRNMANVEYGDQSQYKSREARDRGETPAESSPASGRKTPKSGGSPGSKRKKDTAA